MTQANGATLKDQAFISLSGIREGAMLCMPGLPGVITFAVVFGTVAAQKGLSFAETLLINSVVFAGASQFVAMEIYSDPVTWGILVAMTGVTAAVNMRMLLIGASLRPWLGPVEARKTYPSLFFLTDLNWLISLKRYDEGARDWGIYFGSGVFLWAVWSLAVIPGYFFGSLVTDPERYGLDLFMPAFFVALLVPLWKGHRQTLIWGISGGVAIGTYLVFGGYWGIMTGAIAGAVTGAYLDD